MHDARRRHERIAQKAWQNCQVVRHEVLPAARTTEQAQAQALVHEQDEARKALVLPRGDEFVVWGGDRIEIFGLEKHGHQQGRGFKLRSQLPTAGVNWWTVSHDGGDVLVTGVEEYGVDSWRITQKSDPAPPPPPPPTPEPGNTIGSVDLLCSQPIVADALSVVATPGRVVVADEAGHITLFELHPETGLFKRIETWYNVHRGFIVLAAHQRILVAATPDYIKVWDCQKRRCLGILPVPDIDPERSHILDMDSDVLIASRFNALNVYAMKEYIPILRVILLAGSKIRALKLLCDRKALVGVNEDGTVLLVCLNTGSIIDRIQTPIGEVYSIDVTCDARLLLASRKAPFGVAVLKPMKATPLGYAVRKHTEHRFGNCFSASTSLVRRRRRRRSILTVVGLVSLMCCSTRLLRSK